ncbi:MAG: apolipoprotein N-acyltransferase [Vicinamibacteria bacterium]|nr:apolipoprotein N-acyltransferase [Vicinamibacteria bacterium]
MSWALAVLSGILLVFSFPKFGHGAFAWAALAPLLVSLSGRRGLAAAVRGYATGVVSAAGLLYWTALVARQHGGLPIAASVLVAALLVMAVALFTALFAWLVSAWRQAWGKAALLLSPLAWVTTEILRAHTFFRFPWCLLGYSQHDNPPVLQIAAYAAVYGVSFILALSSAVIAFAAIERRRSSAGLSFAFLALVLLACWTLGLSRMKRCPGSPEKVRVGLVQASIPQDEKWDPAHAWRNIGLHERLTRRATLEGARLVIWPESAVPFYYDRTPAVSRSLNNLAREERIWLLFGNDDVEEDELAGKILVGAKLLDPEGRLVLRYHKIRLVPFGEYVPMAPILERLGVEKLVEEVGSFTPGREPRVGLIEGRRIATTICYETIFPDLVRRFTANGAELLVNVTNDGWYGRTSAPYQHFAMARFRAVENGRYLLRAANTGISAIIDPCGRVLHRTALFERTVLVGDAGYTDEMTPYARHGDVFAWGCLAASVALTLAARLRRK